MGVYKRNDTGVWEFRKCIRGVKFYEPIPGAKNRPQAEMAEALILRKIYEGRYGKEGKEIGSADFVAFCTEVYLPDIKQRLRQWKNEEYKVNMLCNHPRLKGKQFKDITLVTVQALRRDRLTGDSQRKRPRQAATVKGEISTLSAIFEMAIDMEEAVKNPCRKLKWGRGQAKSERDRVLSYTEEVVLMPLLGGETRMAVILALNTGLRRMGILMRKVSDVNPEERKLRYIAKGGKEKYVPLNDEAWAVIEELMKNPAPGGFLFHVRTGHNLSASEGAFQLAVRRAGLPNLVFHDLRHTFSDRVRTLTDAFTVKDLMGHEDVKTTDIYVPQHFDRMRAAVGGLGKHNVLNFKTG